MLPKEKWTSPSSVILEYEDVDNGMDDEVLRPRPLPGFTELTSTPHPCIRLTKPYPVLPHPSHLHPPIPPFLPRPTSHFLPTPTYTTLPTPVLPHPSLIHPPIPPFLPCPTSHFLPTPTYTTLPTPVLPHPSHLHPPIPPFLYPFYQTLPTYTHL